MLKEAITWSATVLGFSSSMTTPGVYFGKLQQLVDKIGLNLTISKIPRDQFHDIMISALRHSLAHTSDRVIGAFEDAHALQKQLRQDSVLPLNELSEMILLETIKALKDKSEREDLQRSVTGVSTVTVPNQKSAPSFSRNAPISSSLTREDFQSSEYEESLVLSIEAGTARCTCCGLEHTALTGDDCYYKHRPNQNRSDNLMQLDLWKLARFPESNKSVAEMILKSCVDYGCMKGRTTASLKKHASC